MRGNSNEAKGRGGVARIITDDAVDFAYSSINSSHGNKQVNVLDSLIGSFPCSPPPMKTKSAEQRTFQSDSAAPPTSSSVTGENGNPNVTIIPYESQELDRFVHTKSCLTPVKEVVISAESPNTPPAEDDDGGAGWVGIGLNGEAIALQKDDGGAGWVGTGLDGEAIALSVCSESPEGSSVGPSSIQDQHIPKAIDFQRFEFDNLPIIEEDKIARNENELKKPSAAEKVLQDVEELSVNLSVLEDLDSIASVITKEGAIDLAKRLERMEHQLLELAGETGKVDALRALASAAHKQAKRADSLQRKVRKQEKKISTLNDLCQRLLDGKREANELRSTTQKEMDELKDANSEMMLRLLRGESRNEELSSKLKQQSEKLQKMEEENVQTSNLLLRSYSPKKNANNKEIITQSKFNELHEESRRRAEEDKATIRKLEAGMSAMAKAHAKKEKRSKNKIQILVEMKSAMEEQIKLLEGDDDSV